MASRRIGAEQAENLDARTTDDARNNFPPEPKNFGPTPEFSALTILFNVLQADRKIEMRRRHLDKWFSVRIISLEGVAKSCYNPT